MSLGRHAPGGAGMTAAGGFAFAAAHGMIHGIHYHAANVRTPPQPSGTARLADVHVFMFVVSHLADGRHAFNEDLADFSGRQPHLGVTPFLGHQLTVSARRANQLSAASNLQLYIVNQRAQWNVPQGNGIARFDIRFLPADQNLADADLRRGHNVSFLTVAIIQKSDPGRSVRVVLNGRHFGRNVRLVAAKIDHPVLPLVAAADVARRNAPVVVASARSPDRLQKTFDRLGGGDLRKVRNALKPSARRCRFVFSDSKTRQEFQRGGDEFD